MVVDHPGSREQSASLSSERFSARGLPTIRCALVFYSAARLRLASKFSFEEEAHDRAVLFSTCVGLVN